MTIDTSKINQIDNTETDNFLNSTYQMSSDKCRSVTASWQFLYTKSRNQMADNFLSTQQQEKLMAEHPNTILKNTINSDSSEETDAIYDTGTSQIHIHQWKSPTMDPDQPLPDKDIISVDGANLEELEKKLHKEMRQKHKNNRLRAKKFYLEYPNNGNYTGQQLVDLLQKKLLNWTPWYICVFEHEDKYKGKHFKIIINLSSTLSTRKLDFFDIKDGDLKIFYSKLKQEQIN